MTRSLINSRCVCFLTNGWPIKQISETITTWIEALDQNVILIDEPWTLDYFVITLGVWQNFKKTWKIVLSIFWQLLSTHPKEHLEHSSLLVYQVKPWMVGDYPLYGLKQIESIINFGLRLSNIKSSTSKNWVNLKQLISLPQVIWERLWIRNKSPEEFAHFG